MPQPDVAVSPDGRRWRLLFKIAGAILAAILTDLTAFHPTGRELHVCYAIGGACALLCAYAAARLRDVERTLANADADRLLDDAAAGDVDGADD